MSDPNATPPLLHDKQQSLADCLPDSFDFLDEYQAEVRGQMAMDVNGRTIKRQKPLNFMLAGIEDTTVGLDVFKLIDDDFTQSDSLSTYIEKKLFAGATQEAVAQLIKRLGGTAWYLANYLSLQDIAYSKTIQPGLELWTGRNWPTSIFSELSERETPGFLLGYHASHLRLRAQLYAETRSVKMNPSYRAAVVAAAGSYTLAAMLVLNNKFDTTYEDVLRTSLTKPDEYMANSTFPDKQTELTYRHFIGLFMKQ